MADRPMYESGGKGPAVHALVVGVGHYPHLRGGGKRVVAESDGMGQLTSAPASARAFATWVLEELNHPEGLPVGSLRLLVSEKSIKPFRQGAMRVPVKPPAASVVEVTRAVDGWISALSDPNSVGLFFFSGHGVSSGLEQALLLRDFGERENDPYDGAINLSGFHVGMERAAARRQLFFNDSCRTHSDNLTDTYGLGGRPLATPGKKRAAAARVAPVFNACLQGQQAYGLTNAPSVFTGSLLNAMKGGGADDRETENDWIIQTSLLADTLEFLSRRLAKRLGLATVPVPSVDHSSKLALHRLSAPPVIPIETLCAPHHAGITVTADHGATWNIGDAPPFVPVGRRTFAALTDGPPALTGQAGRECRPPHRSIDIPMVEQ